MKSTIHLFVFIALFTVHCSAQNNIPKTQDQIAAAVLAAPEDLREGASVLGYDQSGTFVGLRKGTNEIICLADDPNKAGFSVACYHKDLEPFMARGRALKAEGKKSGEVFDIRENEVQAGTLIMPSQPTTLHILSGAKGKYDPETGTVSEASYRYVVYIPYATPETTGLPLKPIVPGGPWIMDPGTHRAHIMISPPN